MSDPTKATALLFVTVYDGKYTVVQEADGGIHALRYGAEWRDCCGDGLILALAQDLEEARAERDALKRQVEAMREVLENLVCAREMNCLHEQDYNRARAALSTEAQ